MKGPPGLFNFAEICGFSEVYHALLCAARYPYSVLPLVAIIDTVDSFQAD